MDVDAYQAMPSLGKLAKNLNLSMDELSIRIASFQHGIAYSYIVDTVEYHEGRLYQTGSGPNFQGGLVTLCSCKHMMRTFLDVDSWKGVWIAGFTSSRDFKENKLFYLMKVSEAFESHSEFWASDSISQETKTAKGAHLDRFGDIYQPKNESGNPHYYWNYIEPCKNHVHCEPGNWHEDIGYRNRYGRRPALLVGDPELSFLWDRPIYTSPFKHSRGQKKTKLSDLFPHKLGS